MASYIYMCICMYIHTQTHKYIVAWQVYTYILTQLKYSYINNAVFYLLLLRNIFWKESKR